MPLQIDEAQYESGASSHLDRMGMTQRLCQLLEPLFQELSIDYMDYGQDVILSGSQPLLTRLKRLDVKKSPVVCMTKFSPDYLIYGPTSDSLFFMDAKASITPMYFGAAIRKLQLKSRRDTLSHHTVGEIEREAWDNYTTRYPQRKVAICLAAPYHPRRVVAEWATNLTAFHRFEEDTNTAAAGSGTPHVNIDLSEMRSLKDFLSEECSVTVDLELYDVILDEIARWPLNKPPIVNWTVFNNVVATLAHKCPWLRGRLPKGHENSNSIIRKLDAAGVGYTLF